MARAELAIRVSSWASIWPEARPMLAAHWAELGQGTPLADLPFEIDLEMARAMDLAGLLVVTEARDGTELVGYCIWYLSTLLESKGVRVASQGPWYVREDHRQSSAWIRLYDLSRWRLAELGVKVALPHHWALGGGERLGRFFLRRGATPLEHVYAERIGG